MKIGLIVIGKTDAGYFVEAINEYKNRLTHYIPFFNRYPLFCVIGICFILT